MEQKILEPIQGGKTMKNLIIGLASSVLLVPFAVSAKEKDSGLTVVYVSVNEAVEKTGEQGKIRQALEKEKNRIQQLIRKKSEGFNSEAVKIRKKMAILSDEEKVKKYESIQKMQLAMEQFVKGKEMEFQKKEANLRNNVINRIKTVVNQVAQKEKVDVVRNKDGTLWVHPKIDLTDKVVRLYKKKYK